MPTNIQYPPLPAGWSFTPGPQRAGNVQAGGDLIKDLLGEIEKKRLSKHESALLRQLLEGQPLTGTRPQEGTPSQGSWLTRPFRTGEYTGPMTDMEKEMGIYSFKARQALETAKANREARLELEREKSRIKNELETTKKQEKETETRTKQNRTYLESILKSALYDKPTKEWASRELAKLSGYQITTTPKTGLWPFRSGGETAITPLPPKQQGLTVATPEQIERARQVAIKNKEPDIEQAITKILKKVGLNR